MRLEPAIRWLSLLGIMVCGAGMAIRLLGGGCALPFWFCDDRGLAMNLARMALPLLLSLLAFVMWGVLKAAWLFLRTRRALQPLLRLPRSPLPPALHHLAVELAIDDRLDLVACPCAEAFCYGLLRPRICVTTGLLSVLAPAEAEAVLRHERHHLRCRDPLRTLLWTVLDAACWWVEDGAEQDRLRRELAADRAVIAAQGQQPLASALVKLLTRPQSTTVAHGTLAVSSLSITDVRIDQLLNPQQEPMPALDLARWLAVPLAAGAAILLCALLMMPA